MKKVPFIIVALVMLLPFALGACNPQPAATQVAPPLQTATPAVTAPPAITAKPAIPATPAATAKPAWQQDWDTTLAAAQKEGTVTVFTGFGPEWRQKLSAAMSSKYGIVVDTVVGPSSDIVQRIMREQQSKTYSADAISFGTTQWLAVLKPEGVLQPFDKALILPEVIDPKAWWKGVIPWVDPDTKTYFQYNTDVQAGILYNTDLVKSDEMKGYKDLLDPKWKGKIVMFDPTIAGPGQNLMILWAYGVMDWDSISALVKQEPILVKDLGTMGTWVAQGKYPLAAGLQEEVYASLAKAGAPIKAILPAEGTYISGGNGYLSHPKGGPHPNANKIFSNFLLSKEGQMLSSRASGNQSGRLDVPENLEAASPAAARANQLGLKKLVATTDPDFMASKPDIQKKVVELFKPLLQK